MTVRPSGSVRLPARYRPLTRRPCRPMAASGHRTLAVGPEGSARCECRTPAPSRRRSVPSGTRAPRPGSCVRLPPCFFSRYVRLPESHQSASRIPPGRPKSFSSTISPSFQRATVQNSSSKVLPVALYDPSSGTCHGPIIFPFQLATVQVQSPEANMTCRVFSKLFSIDLKNASDSA